MTDQSPAHINNLTTEEWKARAIAAEQELALKVGLIRRLRQSSKGYKKTIRKLKRGTLELLPLDWQGNDPDYTTADTILGRAEIINTYHERGFSLVFASDRISTFHPSMDAAKAAALSKIEEQMRSAIRKSPSHAAGETRQS